MALRTQTKDGTVEDANSYADVDFFKAYHGDAGVSLSSYTDPMIEGALVRACRYLDTRFPYRGRRTGEEAQETAFPRDGNEIPKAVLKAQAEYALKALTSGLYVDYVPDESGREVLSISEAVDGAVSEAKTFAPGLNPSFQMPRFPLADRILQLAGLVASSNGRVIRG